MAQAELIIHSHFQLEQVKDMMEKLEAPKLNRALRNAVNDTARQVERFAEREVAKATSIPVKRVKQGIFIRPFATEKLLEANIRGSSSPIPLKVFKAKETKKGVKVKIWGKNELIPTAFIKGGKFPNRVSLGMGGHVFERIGRNRMPIRKLPGVSIAEGMTQEAISTALVAHGHERMLVNLRRQLDRYTRSRK